MSEQSYFQNFCEEQIQALKQKNLYRVMPKVSGTPGPTICIDGKKVLNFSSNNYLGLAGHPSVVKALAENAMQYGAGSTASRLIAGNNSIHRELEEFIAGWKGTESCLIFGSGYQANVGVLSCLMGPTDLIISDELNHASIIDGCRLSRARVLVYPHLDLNRLEDALKTNGFRRKLVVTESIFSMDGDAAPLKEIDELCKRTGASLMVDEAHASGVRGADGQGLAAELGVIPDIQMGTLGKAAGTSGAYVAGRRMLVELLTNRARSLIYTTAPPPAIVGAALAALKLISSEEGQKRRARLQKNIHDFHEMLVNNIADFLSATSHIVPVRIGESRRTVEVSNSCLEKGLFAHGIRYPTVPEGTGRLRFTLMSDHSREDLETAVNILREVLKEEKT
jgi:8-amino-7-oxononanoate synthase